MTKLGHTDVVVKDVKEESLTAEVLLQFTSGKTGAEPASRPKLSG